MIKQLTFSHQVKDELSRVECSSRCCQQAEISATFYGAGRFAGDSIAISTVHAGFALRLANLIRQRYKQEVDWQAGRELLGLTIETPLLYQAISQDIGQLFGTDQDGPAGCRSLSALKHCCRQAILRALFLICGSISKPISSYHLELSIHQSQAATMAANLLNQMGIHTGLVKRHGYDVVYIKEGQHIAEFLLQTGAHHSLLTFESLRVEKEMRNSVNRVVNCDSANIQRIANTAARQLDLIRRISEHPGLGILPPDLQQAAEARLMNPDLSLKELGECMQPSLGKSGMNHRLKRLEQIAAELLAPKGDVSDES
jgi:cell division protein WhiA